MIIIMIVVVMIAVSDGMDALYAYIVDAET